MTPYTATKRRRVAIATAPKECATVADHCPHIAGPVFMMQITQPLPRQVLAQAKTCCKCGRAFMIYAGIVEEGHGPYVSYQADSPVSPIALPNGMHRETRPG